jgi:15-cis-phytoene synthase
MRNAMPAAVTAALHECRGMIARGSKSFSLAAKLFPTDIRDAACFLYGWCRYCDDQIDEAGKCAGAEDLERRLTSLRDKTAAAFSSDVQEEPVFIALQYVAHLYGIPSHYALELIEGMAMDVRCTRYVTLGDLLLYCYRVAGTVGLMMSHIMGLRDERALKHAADLGIAMQLTNIARDITADAAMGRIYLPLQWLREANIAPDDIAAAGQRDKLALLTARLLRKAERYYRSGDEGLWDLSFRSACAVAAARGVYSEIGNLLLRRGPRAWDQRGYVTGARKDWVVLRAITGVMRSVPARIAQPWTAAPLRVIWKYSNVQ